MWGCIASPQMSFGVRSSHIPFSLRGGGMNVWRTNPKDICREAREGVQNCLALFQMALSELSNYNNKLHVQSYIYLCLLIDKQPVRECTVQILNFLKAFFWSSLTHISRLRCLHLLGLRASLTPSLLTQSTCGKSIQIGICKQYCFPLPPPILFVCLF